MKKTLSREHKPENNQTDQQVQKKNCLVKPLKPSVSFHRETSHLGYNTVSISTRFLDETLG